MGGKGPEVLTTLTADFGKILSGLHSMKIYGSSHLATGIQVAGVCFDTPILHIDSYLSLSGLVCTAIANK